MVTGTIAEEVGALFTEKFKFGVDDDFLGTDWLAEKVSPPNIVSEAKPFPELPVAFVLAAVMEGSERDP